MSRAMVCDNCGAVLPLDLNGGSSTGEDSAWIAITAANSTFEVCTRSCAHELLDRPDVVEAINAWLETVTDIANSIAEARADRDSPVPPLEEEQ